MNRLGAITLVVVLGGSAVAFAQRLDTHRGRTVILEVPRDPRRTPLPEAPLRQAWRRAAPFAVDRAPFVTVSGDVVLVGRGGEVAVFGDDGAEKRRPWIPNPPLGAVVGAALTADGTVIVLSTLGTVVGFREGVERFRARLGGTDPRGLTGRGGVLPLDDGGTLVNVGTELLALDEGGLVRTRVSLPEAPAVPLREGGGHFLAVSARGTVYGWRPGREPIRLGALGGSVGDGVAIQDATLLAVVGGQRLVALDLGTGSTRTWATAPADALLLGPPVATGASPPGRGPAEATLLVQAPGRTSLWVVASPGDDGGAETSVGSLRMDVAHFASTDGGAGPPPAPRHVAPLVGSEGAIAFLAPSGTFGVARRGGTAGSVLDLYGEPCGRAELGVNAASSAGAALAARLTGLSGGAGAGLSAAGPQAVVIACESGQVVRVVGGTGQMAP